jgi:hypothetical protein
MKEGGEFMKSRAMDAWNNYGEAGDDLPQRPMVEFFKKTGISAVDIFFGKVNKARNDLEFVRADLALARTSLMFES